MTSTEQVFTLHESKISAVKLTILSLLSGISLPLFCRAISKLKRRGFNMRSSLIVFCGCLTNIFLLVLTFGITFAIFLLTLGRTTSVPSKHQSILAVVVLQEISMQLVPLTSDAIVVWRALALCAENRWSCIALRGIFFGTAVISIISFVFFDYQAAVSYTLGDGPADRSGIDPDSLMLFLPFSTVTNAVATLCIWLKLWTFRKNVKALDLHTIEQSSADRILVLLVESGVFYCIIQVVNVVVTYTLGRLSMTTSVIFPIYFAFTAMYPSMVVVFINEKRSVVETFITSMSRQSAELDPVPYKSIRYHTTFQSQGTINQQNASATIDDLL